mmetsp:Transcript_20340/g.45211  ORF Transcript_20340/g.45211 Transcript_20340/m.45211 type:complete len:435 (+) Transcript_20340:3-1307(+)
MSLSFGNLRISGSETPVHFKCDTKQIGWRDINKGVSSFQGSQLQRAEWVSVGPQKCMLALTVNTTKGLVVHRLAGFAPSNEGSIRSHFLSHFKVDVSTLKSSSAGRSWFTAAIRDDLMRLVVPGTEDIIADIDKRRITNVVEPPDAPHETVIKLEAERLHDDDDVVTELRFCVPPGRQEFLHHMAEFKDTLEGEYVVDESQVPIARFTDITLVLPRGKFEMQLFGTSLRMHGKSASHSVEYGQVRRAFLLPKPDGKSVAFVLILNPPLLQGKTEYSQLVMPLETNRPVSIVTAGDKNNDLQAKEEGELAEVLPRVFKSLSGHGAVGPTAGIASSNGFHCVNCAHKTFEGHLYFLEDSLLFVNRPCCVIRYKDIKEVEFQRIDSGRTFDLVAVTKLGFENQFSAIDKSDLDALRNFLNSKQVGGAEPPAKQARTE